MEHTTNDMAALLTAPLPSLGKSQLGALPQYAASLLWDQLIKAADTGLLPQETVLGQFLHVDPATKAWFGSATPTLVAATRKNPILAACRSLRTFLQANELSVFNAEARRTGRKGLILVASLVEGGVEPHRFEGLRDIADVLEVCCRPGADLDIELTIDEAAEPDAHDLDRDWLFFADGSSVETCQDAELPTVELAVSDPKLLGQLLPNEADADRYFRELLPMMAQGTVVFCVPRIYEDVDPSDSWVAGGGCVFVVNRELREDDVRSLFIVSHNYECLIESIS